MLRGLFSGRSEDTGTSSFHIVSLARESMKFSHKYLLVVNRSGEWYIGIELRELWDCEKLSWTQVDVIT